MPDCTVQEALFGRGGRRRVEVGFAGGEVTSDAGLLLIRNADEQIGLPERAAAVLPDPRDLGRIETGVGALLRQRVHAQVQGDEDLSDHDRLRRDRARACPEYCA